MLLKFSSDLSPLRQQFIKGNDKVIYDTIINFFNVIKKLLWSKRTPNSYIVKTVGIQATFDILKLILKSNQTIDPDKIDFAKYLIKASDRE